MPEPLEIVIRKGEQPEGVTPGGAGVSVGETPGKTRDGLSPEAKAVNTALIAAGRHIATSGLRMATSLTGNYATMEALNVGLSVGADVLMIAKGGWAGAVVVASKHIIGIGQSLADMYNAQRENELMLSRVGFVSVAGSRYTND